MNSRNTRNKREFQIESLESRKAPSNVSAFAHVVTLQHHGHEVVAHKAVQGEKKEDAGKETSKSNDK